MTMYFSPNLVVRATVRVVFLLLLPALTILRLWVPLLVLIAVGWCVHVWEESPVRDVLGPRVAAWTRFWHILHVLRGDQSTVLVHLHEKHGAWCGRARRDP
jgi:hypothetical protein